MPKTVCWQSLLLLIFTLPVCSSAQEKPGMTAIDLLNLPSLSEPQLAPDSNALVYVRADSDWKSNRRVNHLWMKRLPDGQAFQITFGEKGESTPRWSPDSTHIAFLTERGGDINRQIYVMSARGGEARALTDLDTEPASISWAPDGQSMYFLASIPLTEKEKEQQALQDDVIAFDNDWKHRHLWCVSVDDGSISQITEGDFSVIDYSLSNSGEQVVMQRAPSPLLDDGFSSELVVMNLTDKSMQQLTSNSQRESAGQLSPDESMVLYISDTNSRGENYFDRNLFVIPAIGGEPRLLLEEIPYSVLDASWSAEGESILLLANTGVRTNIFKVGVPTGELIQVSSGDHALGGWSYLPQADTHLVVVSTASSPGEVFLLRDGGMSQLSDVFDALTEQFWLPKQEAITWKGADGESVEGVLYYPRDYSEGQRYPLIVQTHGGPRASDKLSFPRPRTFVPLATDRGWFVLQPNYRGSTGYGDEFMRNQVGNYWDQSHLDVMTGVDHLIAGGMVDSERMAKMGWSAGGHMTNKIVTHTDRFRAASSGAGAANWLSMYSQTDIRLHRSNWFGGGPWNEDAPVEQYWDQSPIREAWKVTTPTLLLVGEEDARVPAPQSVEFYRALKANDVETELYIAPREGHGWRELRHQLFKINKEMAWFEEHVLGHEYQWETPPEV